MKTLFKQFLTQSSYTIVPPIDLFLKARVEGRRDQSIISIHIYKRIQKIETNMRESSPSDMRLSTSTGDLRSAADRNNSPQLDKYLKKNNVPSLEQRSTGSLSQRSPRRLRVRSRSNHSSQRMNRSKSCDDIEQQNLKGKEENMNRQPSPKPRTRSNHRRSTSRSNSPGRKVTKQLASSWQGESNSRRSRSKSRTRRARQKREKSAPHANRLNSFEDLLKRQTALDPSKNSSKTSVNSKNISTRLRKQRSDPSLQSEKKRVTSQEINFGNNTSDAATTIQQLEADILRLTKKCAALESKNQEGILQPPKGPPKNVASPRVMRSPRLRRQRSASSELNDQNSDNKTIASGESIGTNNEKTNEKDLVETSGRPPRVNPSTRPPNPSTRPPSSRNRRNVSVALKRSSSKRQSGRRLLSKSDHDSDSKGGDSDSKGNDSGSLTNETDSVIPKQKRGRDETRHKPLSCRSVSPKHSRALSPIHNFHGSQNNSFLQLELSRGSLGTDPGDFIDKIEATGQDASDSSDKDEWLKARSDRQLDILNLVTTDDSEKDELDEVVDDSLENDVSKKNALLDVAGKVASFSVTVTTAIGKEALTTIAHPKKTAKKVTEFTKSMSREAKEVIGGTMFRKEYREENKYQSSLQDSLSDMYDPGDLE